MLRIIAGPTGRVIRTGIWMRRFYRACTGPLTGDGDGVSVQELVGMRPVGVGDRVGIIFRIGTILGTIPGVLLGAGEDGTIGIMGRAGEVGDTAVGDTVAGDTAVGATAAGATAAGDTAAGTMLAGVDGTAGAETPMSGCIAVLTPGQVLVVIA